MSDTTINCEPLKRVRKSWPMCCVCDRSRAASISSRIYIGAGLNCRRDMIRESAMSELGKRISDVMHRDCERRQWEDKAQREEPEGLVSCGIRHDRTALTVDHR